MTDDAGSHHSYVRWTYDAKSRSTYDVMIRWTCGAKSCERCCCDACSSSFCPKICGRCCGRLRRAGVSCFRSCDPTIWMLSAFYRLGNDWTFWLQPLQSSVLGEFAYKA
jgi:hypothetical protein